jgi:hypothetical protein
MPISTTNPTVLATETCISLNDAALLSGKSKNTIRYYVGKGHLKRYAKDLSKSNSPLMICQDELMLYLRLKAKPQLKGKSQGGRTEAKSVNTPALFNKTEVQSEEISLLRKEVELLKASIAGHDAHLEDLRRSESLIRESAAEVLKSRDAIVDDLRLQLEREREKNEQLRAKIDKMSVYFSLPFWRRWNAQVPLLTG